MPTDGTVLYSKDIQQGKFEGKLCRDQIRGTKKRPRNVETRKAEGPLGVKF